MAERSIAPDCKSGRKARWFESISAHQMSLVIEAWRERREKITSVSIWVKIDYSPLVALVDSYGSAMTKN